MKEAIAEYHDNLIRGYKLTSDISKVKIKTLWNESSNCYKIEELHLIGRTFIAELYKFFINDRKSFRFILEAASFDIACDYSPSFFNSIDEKVVIKLRDLINKKIKGDLVFV